MKFDLLQGKKKKKKASWENMVILCRKAAVI